MRNIINIDTFFKDPNRQKLEIFRKKEEAEKAKFVQLKEDIKQEAADKAVETMMLSLDDETINPKLHKFQEPLKVIALHSSPSSPNKIQQTELDCHTEDEIDSFYSDTPGLKMLFVKGNLYRSNVIMQDNEFEYYRLIGEAYNSHVLERAIVNRTDA